MDSEGYVRAWTRSFGLVPDENVFFAAPEHDKPPLPLIIFTRQGGPRGLYFDNPIIVWECWGVNKHEASSISGQLADKINNWFAPTPFIHEGWTIVGADEPTLRPVSSLTWAKRYEVATQLWLSYD